MRERVLPGCCIPAFGEYVHSPLSVCMAKDLGM